MQAKIWSINGFYLDETYRKPRTLYPDKRAQKMSFSIFYGFHGQIHWSWDPKRSLCEHLNRVRFFAIHSFLLSWEVQSDWQGPGSPKRLLEEAKTFERNRLGYFLLCEAHRYWNLKFFSQGFKKMFLAPEDSTYFRELFTIYRYWSPLYKQRKARLLRKCSFCLWPLLLYQRERIRSFVSDFQRK